MKLLETWTLAFSLSWSHSVASSDKHPTVWNLDTSTYRLLVLRQDVKLDLLNDSGLRVQRAHGGQCAGVEADEWEVSRIGSDQSSGES